MPPHILPFGAAGGVAGVAEDDGAGGGSGPELTTPVGVSTGIGAGPALALAAGAGDALGAAVGASAAGVGCAEQLANAANDRKATPACTRFDFRMRHH